MFDGVTDLLLRQWDNQIFAGGLALGALGTGAALAGWLVWVVVKALAARLTPSVTIDRRSPLFAAAQAWLRDHPYTRTCRCLAASVPDRDSEASDVGLVPGDGGHLLRHGRTWFWLTRRREGGGDNRLKPEREVLTLHSLTPGRAALVGLIDSILHTHGRRAGTLGVHAASTFGDWSEVARIDRRPLDSVIVADGLDQDLLADAARFLGRGDWYRQRGIPWRRGYLFHGPPGTGKTSLIRALASELDLDIAMLDLVAPELDDSSLRELLARAPKGAALVLEDIDTVAPGRAPSGAKLSLGGLLNALDGLAAPEGRLLFLTTNHPDRLDPALIRPGRVDRAVALDPLGPAEVERMVARFFPDDPARAVEAAQALAATPITAARLQAILLAGGDEPGRVVAELGRHGREP